MGLKTKIRVAGIAVALSSAVGLAQPADADVVLLDEYWRPEIQNSGVVASEVDTLETEDPSEAKSGEISALLENFDGWPSVRFMGASRLRVDHVPPDYSEASLWYRTDAWEGQWRLELWVWDEKTRQLPKVLEGPLDGGGEGGRLIADDEWHQARGLLMATEDYEDAAEREVPRSTYVWLVPIEGWDIPHRTYVDRIEVTVLVDDPDIPKPAPPAARRVRPDPGAQEAGDGWLWWEGEDAVVRDSPPGGPFTPGSAAAQEKLSNGAWLQSEAPDLAAAWLVDVPETGVYELWCRGFWPFAGFRWRWDDGAWSECTPGDELVSDAWLCAGVPVHWVRVGEVDLPAGRHTLTAEGTTDRGWSCFDCWVLSAVPFEPHGLARPSRAEEAQPEQ